MDKSTTKLVGRCITLGLITLPFFVLSILVSTGRGPSWTAFIVALVLGAASLHGVAIGYHRHLTHRSFEASKVTRAVLTILGAAAVQGGPLGWVATHRVHHRNTEKEGDPHSPGRGRPGLRSLYHAHLGWLLDPPAHDPELICPDLYKDRTLRTIDRLWPLIAVSSVALLPLLVGYIVGGVGEALTTLLWGGVIRMGVVHHLTWSVNSVAHAYGKQPFPTEDESRNVAWLAFLTCGEGWHNAHHAYPRMARHGMLPGQLDTAAIAIRGLERLGLVWNVKWPDRSRMQRIAEDRKSRAEQRLRRRDRTSGNVTVEEKPDRAGQGQD